MAGKKKFGIFQSLVSLSTTVMILVMMLVMYEVSERTGACAR
jgi:hypothetical protein